MNKKSKLSQKGQNLCVKTISKNSSEIIRFLSLKNYPNLVLSSYYNLKWHHIVRKHWQYKAVIRPYMYKYEQEVKRVCESSVGGYVKSLERNCPSSWFEYLPQFEDSFRHTHPELVSYNNYGRY